MFKFNLISIWADFRKLLAGLWLGAALFFSFAVAQSAFAVLPSTELAGALVSRTLAIVNYSGMAIGLILLLSSFILTRKSFLIWIERLLALVLTLACAAGQFYIGWKMQNLRASIGRPLEDLAAADPQRLAFNELHQVSVWILLTAMIAALVLFFSIIYKPKEIIQKPANDFDFTKFSQTKKF
ncbi:MAG: DUF4149 domain-containing protein [Pyrinomonadaceae bacterium]